MVNNLTIRRINVIQLDHAKKPDREEVFAFLQTVDPQTTSDLPTKRRIQNYRSSKIRRGGTSQWVMAIWR